MFCTFNRHNQKPGGKIMPYIKKEDRIILDPHIDRLACALASRAVESADDAAYAGLLNYTCTRLALLVIRQRFQKIRYWIIATTSGVFHNIADEFYRRLAGPYEDQQITNNGDVDAIEKFLMEMFPGDYR
jgi:hypothetical protein